jgi:hypothetical protein
MKHLFGVSDFQCFPYWERCTSPAFSTPFNVDFNRVGQTNFPVQRLGKDLVPSWRVLLVFGFWLSSLTLLLWTGIRNYVRDLRWLTVKMSMLHMHTPRMLYGVYVVYLRMF